MAILNDDEFTEFEGRSYLNPQVALDESNTFVDNLRQTQQANNQQIKTDTYNLGTEVPSNLGGLTGPESYFTSRYQVPQTNAVVSDLRATAQANALNQVLQNEQDMWKKRYQDAYNAYQKRAWNKNNTAGGGGGDKEEGEDPEYESTSSTVLPPSVTGKEGYYTIVDPASGQIIDVPLDGSGGGEVRDKNRYMGPASAGYVLIATPWRGSGPGQYAYNTPNGELVWVDVADGYKVMYDSKEDKLVQVKE